MTRDLRETGRVRLEILAALMLLGAASFFVVARWQSIRLRGHEAEAVEVLRAIARAQEIFLAEGSSEAGPGAPRPGFLAEIEPQLASQGIALSRGARRGVFVRGGYCFTLYLSGPGGEERRAPNDGAAVGDFWVAYAWPRDFARSGRRVFVMDSEGFLRRWDNETGIFDGPGRIPAAHLAPAPKGRRWPFDRRGLGFLGKVSWKDVGAI